MCDVGEEERELLISSLTNRMACRSRCGFGPGFAPAALERVFEAFLHHETGRLGLGLSILSSIIEAHNGRLWASLTCHVAIFGFIAPAHPAAHREWSAASDQTWQTSSLAGTLTSMVRRNGHYGRCRLSVCARQRDWATRLLSASVAIVACASN